MSSRLRFIFLCMSIYCHLAMGVTSSETIREKANHVYVITCKKTRKLYENVKKHKKIFAACVAYCAFELAGYSHGWDTPLQRLLTPKKMLDDAYERIANLTNADRAELRQEDYEVLRTRCEELEKQLRAINEQQAIKEKKWREVVVDFNKDRLKFQVKEPVFMDDK